MNTTIQKSATTLRDIAVILAAFFSSAFFLIQSAQATTIGTSVSSTNVTSSGYIEIGDHGGDAGASFANGSLNVAGATFVGGALTLDGSVTIGDATTDTITLNARFASDLDPSTNDARDIGAFDLAWNDIFASGTAYIGSLTVDGNATFGNDASADTITLNATFATNGLGPSTNNTLDIGAWGTAWNDVFASGTSYLDAITGINVTSSVVTATSYMIVGNPSADGIATYANGDLTVGNALNVGSGGMTVAGTSQFGNMALGGDNSATLSANGRFDTGLVPQTNNAVDLGAYGNAWANVFASSTIEGGSLLAHHNTGSSTIYAITDAGAGIGGEIIIEDYDGAGCTAIMALNGTLSATTVTCPF